jgi:hypothetical protein
MSNTGDINSRIRIPLSIGLIGIAAGFALLIYSFIFELKFASAIGGIFIAIGAFRLTVGWKRAKEHRDSRLGDAAQSVLAADLVEALRRGETFETAVEDFRAKYAMPYRVVWQRAALQLRTLLLSDSIELRELAMEFISRRAQDRSAPPDQFLQALVANNGAILIDETIHCHQQPPSRVHGTGGRKGKLLLTTNYVYFLAEPATNPVLELLAYMRKQFASDVVGKLPGVSFIVAPIRIFWHGWRGIYRDPFTQTHIRRYSGRLRDAGSFSIPLQALRAVRMTTVFAPVYCVEIEFAKDGLAGNRVWLDTGLRDHIRLERPFPDREWAIEANFRDDGRSVLSWAADHVIQLQILALARGNNILTDWDSESGAAQRALGPNEIIESWRWQFARDPALRKKFKRNRAEFFLGISGAVLSYIAIGLLIGGKILWWVSGIPFLFICAFALGFWRLRGMDHSLVNSAEFESLMTADNPAAELNILAVSNKGKYGIAPIETCSAVASRIIALADSGRPETRRLGIALANSLVGDHPTDPSQLIEEFSFTTNIHRIDGIVVKQTDPAAGTSQFSAILAMHALYLYFFSVGTEASEDFIKPYPDRGSGDGLEASRRLALQRLFRNSESFAIPLNEIATVSLETKPDRGVGVASERASFIVGRRLQGSEIATSVHCEFASLGRTRNDVASWMIELQRACAIRGNVLVWSETSPRIERSAMICSD